MKITGKYLDKLQVQLENACRELDRVARLRVGLLEGGPSIDDEKRAVERARANMIQALRQAGPRLKQKWGLEELEWQYNDDGTFKF